MNPRKPSNGFTVLELMITLAVAVILMAIAVPAFSAMLERTQLTSDANSLHGTFLLARSEAAAVNSPAWITPIDNDWNNGWRLTVGSSSASSPTDPSNTEVMVVNDLSGANTITCNTGCGAVEFRGSGRVASTADFSVCSSDGSAGRQVRVFLTGKARVGNPDNDPGLSMADVCGGSA